jgi:hypothetical protein
MMRKEQYSFVFALLLTRETPGHHRAATKLALRAAQQLPAAQTPPEYRETEYSTKSTAPPRRNRRHARHPRSSILSRDSNGFVAAAHQQIRDGRRCLIVPGSLAYLSNDSFRRTDSVRAGAFLAGTGVAENDRTGSAHAEDLDRRLSGRICTDGRNATRNSRPSRALDGARSLAAEMNGQLRGVILANRARPRKTAPSTPRSDRFAKQVAIRIATMTPAGPPGEDPNQAPASDPARAATRPERLSHASHSG